MTKTLRTIIGSALIALAAVTAPIATATPEDGPLWDCTTMGNQICGPTNAQGVVAGQYVNGTLVPWSLGTVPVWCRDICLGA